MNKSIIRLSSFLVAIFCFVLIFQVNIEIQEDMPIGTNEQFELVFSSIENSKEQLIKEVDDIVTRNDSTLVKVVSDNENYENQTDIVYFGSSRPTLENLVVNDDGIDWLNPKKEGKLISSKDIGSRPLYGTYSVIANENFKEELDAWATESQISVEWLPEASNLSRMIIIASWFLQTGIGNAILISTLLLVSAIAAWFMSKSKARCIRFIGGKRRTQIHVEDTKSVTLLMLQGFLSALLLFSTVLIVISSFGQLKIILFQLVLSLILMVIISIIINLLLSFIVKPIPKYIANRTIPFKRFKQIGIGVRMLAVLLAIFIIPMALSTSMILNDLSNEYSMWENFSNNVRLSFSDVDGIYTDGKVNDFEGFLNAMSEQGTFSMSLVIDSAIEMTGEELGEYDHLIMVDKNWLNTAGIGVNEKRENGEVIPIELNELNQPMQDFISSQMPVWTKSGKTIEPGVGYYKFVGDQFLGLKQGVGYGGSTLQTENPLVIVIDDPVNSLSTDAILLPMCSNGNVIFSDENLVRSALIGSSLEKYISSIDTITDIALKQAKEFSEQAIFYVMACILILISIIYAGAQTAQLWVLENQKRIFILHTFGKQYAEIVKKPFYNEIITLVVTILISSIIVMVLRRPGLLPLLITILLILILYPISSLLAYKVYIHKIVWKLH